MHQELCKLQKYIASSFVTINFTSLINGNNTSDKLRSTTHACTSDHANALKSAKRAGLEPVSEG